MESQPGVFDPLYRSMVQAGEGSGRLEEALDRVANQLERLDALRRQVRSAMMYPSAVLVIAILVMAAVCAFVVPVFTGIFVEIAEDTPGRERAAAAARPGSSSRSPTSSRAAGTS